MPHRPASDALKHVTVLDLTRVRSGPTCVRQLADWGADVIRIETPEAFADDGAVGAARASADYQNLNRNKRSLTLNLKAEEGRALFLRLVERADVVVENFRPAVKDRLGIGYEALRAANPRIVLGSISGFGQDGPDADRPGFDQIAQGMAGLMSITGEPGRGPMRAGIPIADLTAGLFCALGIFVALYERERSGEGQWVATSLIEAQAFMLDFQAARYLIGGEVPGQAGNDHPTSMPTSVYPTADGHINIGVSGERDLGAILRRHRSKRLVPRSAFRYRPQALRQSRGVERADIRSHADEYERPLDRALQPGRRTGGTDQRHRSDVRRTPVRTPGNRAAGRDAPVRPHPDGAPADAAQPPRPAGSPRRRRSRASTPRKSWRRSESARRKIAGLRERGVI